MGRKYIGLLDTLGIDRLVGGDVRECPQPVAEARGLLEFQLLRRVLHEFLVVLAHVLAFAAQEGDGFIDQLAVVVVGDLFSARASAALDLMQQTRARARREHAVRARAQQERALHHVDRAVDGAG